MTTLDDRLAALESAAWAAVKAQLPRPDGTYHEDDVYDALLNLEGVLLTEVPS